jgi:hypothetical protein
MNFCLGFNASEFPWHYFLCRSVCERVQAFLPLSCSSSRSIVLLLLYQELASSPLPVRGYSLSKTCLRFRPLYNVDTLVWWVYPVQTYCGVLPKPSHTYCIHSYMLAYRYLYELSNRPITVICLQIYITGKSYNFHETTVL